MNKTDIAFIGGGNMARSLIGGLIADGYDAGAIWVSDPNAEQRAALQTQYGVQTSSANDFALAQAGVLVLAVKPQIMRKVAADIRSLLQQYRPLTVSIAAGIREPDLRRWLGGELPLVRCMPNTPALVGSGATALYANAWVDDAQKELAESLLRAVGLTVWIEDENLLDTVTALSGSGPAYFFLVMEALELAAVDLGLDAQQARLLAVQTAFGAAKMALESSEGPARLRERVTSPGGTTEQAIKTLREQGLENLFARALKAAQQRSQELGELLGKDE